jgi:hypothetical protein
VSASAPTHPWIALVVLTVATAAVTRLDRQDGARDEGGYAREAR